MTDKMICERVFCPMCGSDFSEVSAAGYDYEYRTSARKFYIEKCRSCGHEYLNPRPVRDSLYLAYPRSYYTLEGRHTDKKSRLISFLKKKVTGRRISYVRRKLKSGARIFEAGCGDCSLIVEIKKECPDWDVSGLDFQFSEDAGKKCRDHDITLLRGNIETFEFSGQGYDLIIANQLIEHLADPAAVIRKMCKALKPGGYISIETPDSMGYDRKFFRKRFWGGYYFPRHLNLFDYKRLKALLSASGMRIEKDYSLVAPVIWAFSLHAMMAGSVKNGKKERLLSWFFSDRNPFCLAFFTLLDLCAIRSGFRTSNQKIIARKEV